MMLYIKVYNFLHVFLKIFSIDIYFCCKLSLIDMRICFFSTYSNMRFSC
jgi:hypothetical protein